MYFEIIGEITDIEIIARGRGIHDLARLRKKYGPGNWRKLKGRATVRLEDGAIHSAGFIGMKHTALAERNSRSSERWAEPMKNISSTRFAICLKNKGSEDLVIRKVYQVLPDEAAEQKGLLRIIDESGEDYLYPASYFFLIDLPQKVERTLRHRVSVAA
jgi:hypothetical protein